MARRLAGLAPGARLTGYNLQPMARRPGAHELIAGVATDPVFGPVILFGHGGVAVEVIGERAVALPPLNETLADDLIGRTRIARLLSGYRDRRAADLEAVRRTLVQLGDLVADLAEVREIDINPLLADEGGVLELDARMVIGPAPPRERLAIRPYPAGLEEKVVLRSGERLALRPIRPPGPGMRITSVAAKALT